MKMEIMIMRTTVMLIEKIVIINNNNMFSVYTSHTHQYLKLR